MAKILVIEDDLQVRTLVARMLTGAGHTVVLARDGVDGLRVFDRESADLVLTDLLMPEKEGIETIKELRKRVAKLPIIAMSGGGKNFNMVYLQVAATLGADAVIEKPFRSADIVELVEQVLSGAFRAPDSATKPQQA